MLRTCSPNTRDSAVIVAQTRVGFLTGGRKEGFRALPQEDQCVQLEEAYGRATVALTRARPLCIIMGPLDMKGLLGAATVVGSLMYGAGHVYTGHANFHLHDDTLQGSVTDSEFAELLARNCCLRAPDFPPPAIAEALEDYVNNYFKVRRLHLIVVDTWRPCCYNVQQVRAVTDQMRRLFDCAESKRVVPMKPHSQSIPLRCRRFVYGYALDHFEFPWPCRYNGGYYLLDTATNDALELTAESYFRPLGLQHFYASFTGHSTFCK